MDELIASGWRGWGLVVLSGVLPALIGLAFNV